MLHHLCSTMESNTKRLTGFGSNIFLSSDKASVSTFLHGITVVQRSLLFHCTYGAESVAGLSHGSSEIDQCNYYDNFRSNFLQIYFIRGSDVNG